MLTGLHDIDWSRLDHAYGTAEDVPGTLLALASGDEEARSGALSHYCSAVLHQGTVYPATTATLPFLLELALDEGHPGRAAIVDLLGAVAENAVEHEVFAAEYGYEPGDAGDCAAYLRGRAEEFVTFGTDGDRLVRQAAIPVLGLLLDDWRRAAALLRERLPAEAGAVERLLVLRTAASLALRLPEAVPETEAWLGGIARDGALDPTTRLGALVHRARCAPESIDAGTVEAAIALLRERTAPESGWWRSPTPPRPTPAVQPSPDVPPHVLAAFAELDRAGVVHTPTSTLLSTFHEVLASRVPERTRLLAEQLRDPDPGARIDAMRMGAELMRGRRGDHGALVSLIGGQLADPRPDVAAEAAAALNSCHPIAGPAREALAAFAAAGGSRSWAAVHPEARRAHQEAVIALARLGDERAAPSLLFALESGEDSWRAAGPAGELPDFAAEFTPALIGRVRAGAPSSFGMGSELHAAIGALARLGAPDAVPVLVEKLDEALRLEEWDTAKTTLQALRRLGPAASPALPTVRALATDPPARNLADVAVAALWAITGDAAEVLPLAIDRLENGNTGDATELLAELGPAAAPALPRLRELMAEHDRVGWGQVNPALAVWAIGGEPEAEAVLAVLLPAWERNSSTGGHVAACLERMGPAAAPAAGAVREQLARPERGGRFGGVAEDEELQALCRTVLSRFPD